MDVSTTVLAEMVRALFRSIEAFARSNNIPHEDVSTYLDAHLRSVAAWSSQIQFFGMAHHADTDRDTVPLDLQSTPRKFSTTDTAVAVLSESDLINTVGNYVILGDPGSGKTTTLQRLARRLLTQDRLSENDDFQYPILVKLRDLPDATSVTHYLASTFGLPHDDIASTGEKSVLNLQRKSTHILLYEFLNSTKPVLLLDGIDEVDASSHRRIEKELDVLARHASSAKFICTCRSGDYTRTIVGYHTVELKPLSRENVLQITERWAHDPDEFLRSLDSCPYSDLSDRPLFLTHLIIIHNTLRSLPKRASDVYKRVVLLLLEKWDSDRQISRTSKYAHFDPDQKREFLASLSFHLTYKSKKKSFSYIDFVEGYINICSQFLLPTDEAEVVASEIESHTGLLVQSSNDEYEFSHLSLQEYLAADYIVRTPIEDNIKRYLNTYPAPIAIAIALSSNPSQWFAALFLRNRSYLDIRLIPEEIILPLLSRLEIERPMFAVDKFFGISVMKIVTDFRLASTQPQLLVRFLNQVAVLDSIALGMDWYFAKRDSDRHDVDGWPSGLRIYRRRDIPEHDFYKLPESLFLSKELVSLLSRSGHVNVLVVNRWSGLEESCDIGSLHLQ